MMGDDDDLHNFINICDTIQEESTPNKIPLVKVSSKNKRPASNVPRIKSDIIQVKNNAQFPRGVSERKRKPDQTPVQALQVEPHQATINLPVSRRRQHQATVEALQDAPQRANYMATYHAKPYELDRRSDAVHPSIPQSHDSQHLFQSTTTEISSSSSIQQTTCPFEACNVHPRIIRAITANPKCNLLLSRPTIIQQNTWNQILHRFPSSTKDGSSSKYNYFIQSETGTDIFFFCLVSFCFSLFPVSVLFLHFLMMLSIFTLGSGKTLAYLVPILQFMAQRRSVNNNPSLSDVQTKEYHRQHLTAIILCPTRELTIQTGDLVHNLCMHSFPWMVSGTLSGGEKRKTEKALLRRGVHILISTPGRLLDHLHKTSNLLLSLQKFPLQWLVLDETDRLLMDGMSHVDLKNLNVETMIGSGGGGLQKQVQEIIQIIRHQGTHSWQSILVSATISDRLQLLAKKILSSSISDPWIYCSAKPTIEEKTACKDDHQRETNGITYNQVLTDKHIVSTSETSSIHDNENTLNHQFTESTPQQLTQLFMVVSMKLRLPALVAFLTTRIAHRERMVVFMSTCDAVDFYSKLLQSFPCIMKETTGRKRGETADLTDEKSTMLGIFGDCCSIYRLHGNVPHHERQRIVTHFSDVVSTSSPLQKKEPAVLFATDVAARGLNFPSIDWIIQYDPPCETSDYVHRAGRAARAGKSVT